MKKTFLAAALFAVVGAAQAANPVVVPDADFQWKGTIPGTINTVGNFFVVSPDGSELTNIGNGSLNFTNIEGKVELDQSSSFDFRVVQGGAADAAYDPELTAYTNVDFSLDLVSLESGREGFLSGQDDGTGYFAIEANDTRLYAQGSEIPAEGTTSISYAAGDLANLRVIKNPTIEPIVNAEGETIDNPALNEVDPLATANTPWHVHARVAITTTAV